jgi:prolipoprotein diacylglyceryltransferase
MATAGQVFLIRLPAVHVTSRVSGATEGHINMRYTLCYSLHRANCDVLRLQDHSLFEFSELVVMSIITAAAATGTVVDW